MVRCFPKGKGKGGKSKGKGKLYKSYAPQGKGGGKFSVRKGNASLDERRRRLDSLKRSTKCHGCGESGHWAGDDQRSKNKGKGKGTIPTGSLTVSSEGITEHAYSGAEEDYCAYVAIGSAESSAEWTNVTSEGSPAVPSAPVALVPHPRKHSANQIRIIPIQNVQGGDHKFSYGPYNGGDVQISTLG